MIELEFFYTTETHRVYREVGAVDKDNPFTVFKQYKKGHLNAIKGFDAEGEMVFHWFFKSGAFSMTNGLGGRCKPENVLSREGFVVIKNS